MKKLFLVLAIIGVLGFASPVVFAQDLPVPVATEAPEVVAPTVVPEKVPEGNEEATKEATKENTEEAMGENTEEAMAITDEGSQIKAIVWNIAEWIISIVGPIFALILATLAWKLLGKFGIEKNTLMDQMIKNYAKDATDWVEEQAHKKAKTEADKLDGNAKMALAVEKFKKMVEESGIAKKFIKKYQDKAEEFIETKLGEKRNEKGK